jgi:uridine kinase
MNEEIDSINQVLPDTDSFYKDEAIKDWLVRTSTRMEHYTSEHYKLLKDNMTQLELALMIMMCFLSFITI